MTLAPGMPSTEAPDQAISLTQDGLLRKLTVEEGSGDLPPVHSRCLVHYVGRLATNGEVFMDARKESTANEPVTIVAGRDTIRHEQGLHLAVASMRVGERAWFWVDAQYGWGTQGNFSFPTIPPNASLTYEIELIDYEPPSEDKSYREMTYEERLEASDRRRAEGNEAFKAGLYEDALKRYGAALSFIDEDMLMQLAGFHYDRAIAARIPALLNMAACHIQLGDHDSAVAVTSQVLSEDSRNVKALYRRGVAKHALGQTEAALKDLENASKHAPEDVSIKKELLAVRRSMQEERRAGATLFQGLLNKRPQSVRLTKDGSEGEDEDEENEEDRKATTQSFMPTTSGWLMDFLRALCPFMFRKSDRHLHSS